MGALFSRVIMPPSVRWDEHDQAHVSLACGGENATVAAERAKQIIERNAANVAHIYIQGIEVLQTEPLDA